MPDMAHSVPYDAFAPNPVTRDGKTLLAPVSGTIPRGFVPFHYAAGPEEAERAGRELANPIPPTPQALARGEELFQTFCAVCHGVAGKGDGPLVPKIPNPPAYSSDRVRAFAAGRIYHVITRGAGLMPSYASQVTPEERWLIVHHVQRLQAGETAR